MQDFIVPVEFARYGFVRVKAETVEDAIAKAEANKDVFTCPTDSMYIEDSFMVVDEPESVILYTGLFQKGNFIHHIDDENIIE